RARQGKPHGGQAGRPCRAVPGHLSRADRGRAQDRLRAHDGGRTRGSRRQCRRRTVAPRRPAPGRIRPTNHREEEHAVPKGLTAVLIQPGRPLELEMLPTPEVEPGGILIKNTAAAICGSDLHYWRNDGNYSGPDMRRVPGHEFTGVVASLGKGVTTDSLRRPLKEGDRVAFPFFNPCNRCYWCVRGEHHACPHRQRRSMQFTLNEYPYCDGGYAEYYFLPPGHYVFKVPDILPDEAIPPVNCAM